MADPQRVAFMAFLMGELDKPYIWDCKTGHPGWDCSGLATGGIFAVGGPDWRHKNARMLFESLSPIEPPDAQPGDLVLYGGHEGHMHVMIWWGDNRVFGATGGGHSCTTPEIAKDLDAKVRFKLLSFRNDLRGFRSAPFPPFEKEVPNA